ncbi:MAG: hypothetical protein AB7G44_11670, partial [Bacteroidia bacterium]
IYCFIIVCGPLTMDSLLYNANFTTPYHIFINGKGEKIVCKVFRDGIRVMQLTLSIALFNGSGILSIVMELHTKGKQLLPTLRVGLY